MAAFELALEQNADGIETDVFMTRDGEIVCIHDPSTRRTGKLYHNVVQASYNDIRKLDVGTWKHSRFREQRIPRLVELFDWLPSSKYLFLEIKDGLRIIEPLRQLLIRARFPVQQLRLMSFEESIVAACGNLLPQVQTLLLVDYKGLYRYWRPGARRTIRKLLKTGASGVNSRGLPGIVKPAWVTRLHAAGFSAHVWTINRPDRIRYFNRCGVDSITTDRPDLVYSELNLSRTKRNQRRRYEYPDRL